MGLRREQAVSKEKAEFDERLDEGVSDLGHEVAIKNREWGLFDLMVKQSTPFTE